MIDTLVGKCYWALMLDDEDEYEEVIDALTKHLIGDPTNIAAINNRGVACREMGCLSLALADFTESARLSRTDPMPVSNLGSLQDEMGNETDALVNAVPPINEGP